MKPQPPIVAVDTGGTFTDLLLLSDGQLRRLKIPSTPDDPAEAVLAGIDRLVPEGSRFLLVHGSTVATNALLERRGARVLLVTNEGFEDVIEIGRQNRPQLYALVGHRDPPLVAREDRLGIQGRLGPTGTEIAPLDAGELGKLAARTEAAESLAICLLHSYANPEHELAVEAALIDRGLPISRSSAILPEYREYERTSTTVVNAYIRPLMSGYLGRLHHEAGADHLRIMGSGGGALAVERARAEPVHTVLSGPAGGVVGAMEWGRRTGLERIITFDMGGTSTDVSLCPGHPLHTREFEIAGLPVAVPVIDIHTVGAGGGSIARVDGGGALKVGPESSGADPGPICYGQGGKLPTVTDAHVWLGRLPPDGFLGGERSVDRDLIRGPLEALAATLGRSPEEAAEGILAVAESAMERALRVISVERGFDPADFALVAFGGAGGLHAAALCEGLGARGAMIPPDPGLLSAYGMLVAPVSLEISRTLLASTEDPDLEQRVTAALADSEARARAEIEAEMVDGGDITCAGAVDARYRGQSFELRIPADGWLEAFHRTHEARYGYDRRDTPVEVVAVRATATIAMEAPEPARLVPREGPPLLTAERVWAGGEWTEASRIWRADLLADDTLSGPALILDYSGTIWIPSGWQAKVDTWGAVHLDRSRSEERVDQE